MNSFRRKFYPFIVAVLITAPVMGWYWYARMGSTPTTKSNRPQKITNVHPDGPVSYTLVNNVQLTRGDLRRSIERSVNITYGDSRHLRVRSKITSAPGNHIVSNSSQELRIQGNRYAVLGNGAIRKAGEFSDHTLKEKNFPSSMTTYTLALLVGFDLFKGTTQFKKEGDHLRYYSEDQWVELTENRYFVRGGGAFSRLQKKYEPFGFNVDYSETAVDVTKGISPDTEIFDVPNSWIASARGEIGSRIPNHEFRNLNGDTNRIRSLSKPALVNVWATWCPPCVFEVPHLNRVQEAFGDRINVVGISNEEVSTIQSFTSKQP
ncbi:MAG: TlpA family protein disulfide reductase, partial [bacterium]